MSQHVLSGHGTPISNNVAATPGMHYIDLDAAPGSELWLYGTSWTQVGVGGGLSWSSTSTDASATAPVPIDFSVTHHYVINQPASGPIVLDLSAIDPLTGTPPTGQIKIATLSAADVQIGDGANNYGGAHVSLGNGLTISGDVLSVPTGGLGMILTISSLGLVGGGNLLVEATAVTNTTQTNV